MGWGTWLIFRGQVLFWKTCSPRWHPPELPESLLSEVPPHLFPPNSDNEIGERSVNLSFWAEPYNVLTSFQHRLHHCEQSQGVSWLGPRWSSCLALKMFTSHQPEQAGCHPAWPLDAGLSRDDQVQLLIGEKERTTWGEGIIVQLRRSWTSPALAHTCGCLDTDNAIFWFAAQEHQKFSD